ncbi:MAG: Ig-like domain-containing protein [Lachnospiraceae bacterium]
MKEWKRRLVVLLTLVMLISIIPMENVQAATTKISKCTITLSKKSYYYTGSGCKPTVKVKYKKKVLKKGTDYTVSYTNNTNPGTATVTVKGKGRYSGTVKKTFKIKNALTVSLSKKSYTYSGKANKPTVTVKSGKTKLAGKYYSVTYKNNTKAGTAAVIIKGKGKYKGKNAYVTYKISAKSITRMSVALSKTSYTYSGKACKPVVTVKNGSTKLKNGTDYTVKYSNNIKVGTATVTVTGKGNYTGSIRKNYTIKEKPVQNLEFNLPDNGMILEGDKFALSVSGYKDATFTTTDSRVARITENNELYANASGTVTITAKCGNTEIRRQIKVVRLDMNSPLEMLPGDTYQINKTVYGAEQDAFSFASSNTSLATVDQNGLVYAVPGAGGEVEISLIGNTICGKKGRSVKIKIRSLSSLYTYEKTGSVYNSITESATNNLTSGQASDIRVLAYDMDTCDSDGFYYNNQISTVKQGEYNYYFVADTWNNRVMVYRTGEGETWNNDTEPYRVLGQTDFTTSKPLSKGEMGNNLAKMNWPVGVTACVETVGNTSSIHIFVTDSYNDRILVWNDMPDTNGEPADFAIYNAANYNAPETVKGTGEDNATGYINERSTEIGWPWSIWTNGNRLICTDTQASRILIWDGIPTGADDYPDTVVYTGFSSTPRTIITDGEYLIVGDHNVRLNDGSVSPGYHIYDSVSNLLKNGSYQSNIGDKVFTKDQANPGGVILDRDITCQDGTVLKSGSLLMMYAGTIRVYKSEDGTTRKLAYDGEEPDYYIGGGSIDDVIGYYFTGADCQQIIIDSQNNMYTSLYNMSMVVGYAEGTFPGAPRQLTASEINNRPSDCFDVDGATYIYRQGDGQVEAHSRVRPNLSVGTEIDKIDTSAATLRYHFQNCVPDTKDGYMVAACDCPGGSKLLLYRNAPDESGAVPDAILSFLPSENVSFARLFSHDGKTGVIAGGKSTIFVWNDVLAAIDGKAPDKYMRKQVGSVKAEGEAIKSFDYIDGYFLVTINDTVHVFHGFPQLGQEPVKSISFPGGNTLEIRASKTNFGNYICFTGRENGFRIVKLDAILSAAGKEISCNSLEGLVNRVDFDFSINGGEVCNRDMEATASYITQDGHVIVIVGFGQIYIWNSIEDALAGNNYATRLGLGEDYYSIQDMNPSIWKTDFVKLQTSSTLFMPTNITYDERGYLWVADYKFAGGIRRFKGMLEGI